MACEAKGDIAKLKYAYAIDAFACHFLTDLFSAGHVRNQRGELETFLATTLNFPALLVNILTGILTLAQHEVDGKTGLEIENGRNQRWRAYGDGSFFSSANRTNLHRVIEATQASVDELYQAFESQKVPISAMDTYMPTAIDFNPPPIYKIVNNTLELFKDNRRIPVKSQVDYVQIALPFALSCLPDDFVNGFVKGKIEQYLKINFNMAWPVISKIIWPPIDGLTGCVWRIVGIASYGQLGVVNEQMQDKVDELAVIVKETSDSILDIKMMLEKIDSKIDYVVDAVRFNSLNQSVGIVKDELHRLKSTHMRAHDINHEKEISKKLTDVCLRMSRIFMEKENGIELAGLYKQRLQEIKSTTFTDLELTLLVTLWYRQMLDYQIQAFALSKYFEVKNRIGLNSVDSHAQVSHELDEFKGTLVKQIDFNRGFIDTQAIYSNQAYLILQVKNAAKIREYTSQFITGVENE